jgi:hypothetical protein
VWTFECVWSVVLAVTPVMGYSLLCSCGRLNAFDPFAQADDRVSTVFCMPSHSYCFSYFFKLYRCCSGSLDLDLPCRFFRLCHFSWSIFSPMWRGRKKQRLSFFVLLPLRKKKQANYILMSY